MNKNSTADFISAIMIILTVILYHYGAFPDTFISGSSAMGGILIANFIIRRSLKN